MMTIAKSGSWVLSVVGAMWRAYICEAGRAERGAQITRTPVVSTTRLGSLADVRSRGINGGRERGLASPQKNKREMGAVLWAECLARIYERWALSGSHRVQRMARR